MSQDAWNPDQYDRFQQERRLPFYHLVGLVQPQPDMHILDLGCGTGELTRYLHATLKAATTLGIDASARMIARAQNFAGEGLRFQQGLIETAIANSPTCDLVFSNAALHWLPNHETLIPQLWELLKPGGQLAIQVPAMHQEPVHYVAAETALEFSEPLQGFVQNLAVLAPETYARLLFQLGAAEQQVRLQIYGHTLPDREAVISWYRGSMLTGYQQRLQSDTYEQFVQRYREKLLSYLPDEQPFFFPYKRILIWAKK